MEEKLCPLLNIWIASFFAFSIVFFFVFHANIFFFIYVTCQKQPREKKSKCVNLLRRTDDCFSFFFFLLVILLCLHSSNRAYRKKKSSNGIEKKKMKYLTVIFFLQKALTLYSLFIIACDLLHGNFNL